MKRLMTPAAAEAFIAWLDEVLDPGWKAGDGETILDDQLEEVPIVILKPLTSRIVEFFRRMENAGGPRNDLAATFAKIPDPQAESLIAEVLISVWDDQFDPQWSILQALLERPVKMGTTSAIAALEKLATSKPELITEFYHEETPLEAGMILCRWGISGAAERLLAQAKERGPEFLADSIWEHAPDALLDAAAVISPSHRERIQVIRDYKETHRLAQQELQQELQKSAEEE